MIERLYINNIASYMHSYVYGHYKPIIYIASHWMPMVAHCKTVLQYNAPLLAAINFKW